MRLKDKSILVTGGAGFIGRNLVQRLTREGSNVVVVDDFSYGPKKNVPKDVKLIVGDARDLPRMKGRHLTGIDYVIHLGSPSSVILFDRDPQACFDTTVASLLGVFQFAKENGAKKVIFPSSGSVYGGAPPPQSEEEQLQPKNLYAIAKIACEHISEFFADDVKSTGLRIFAGFGPGEGHKGEYASPVSLFLESILKGERPVVFGDGTQTRDFVYVDDVVDSILASMERNFVGVVNVGSGVSTSFNEVVKGINEALGCSLAPRYIGKPRRYLEYTRADVKRMTTTLGVRPTPFPSALRKFVSHGRQKRDWQTPASRTASSI